MKARWLIARRVVRVTLAMPLICALYLLSFGPVYVFAGIPATYGVLDAFYHPVILLAKSPAGPTVSAYARLWSLEIANTGNYTTLESGEEIVWFIRPDL